MSFAQDILAKPAPDSIRSVSLPRRQTFHPSPSDWRDEVIYFLLPDRFSDRWMYSEFGNHLEEGQHDNGELQD
jgi:hypothetical protein